MNISKVTGSLRASFEYHYFDASDEMQTATINLTLKRMSFRNVTAGKFQKAISEIDKKPEEAAALLYEVVESWDLYEDDEETKAFPLTIDNIAEREPAFVSAMTSAVFEKLFPNPPKPQN